MIITIPFRAIQEVEKEGKKMLLPVPPPFVLQNQGAILPVIITHPRSVAEKLSKEGKTVPSINCNALIDTGAFGCVITPKIAEELNLIQTGFQNVTSVQDEQLRPEYFAFIRFNWGMGKEVRVASCPLKGFDCLIGRDMMMYWNFIYNGKDGFIIICD
jgi:predicted aspartyl protease